MAIDLQGVTPLLQVYDMPTAVRFYRDLLGFNVVTTSPPLGTDSFGWALLQCGRAEVMLNTAYESDADRPVAADPARVTAHADTGLYLGCPDVDAAYEQLRRRGANVSRPVVTYYGMKQMYLVDPDGYRICFQWQADRE